MTFICAAIEGDAIYLVTDTLHYEWDDEGRKSRTHDRKAKLIEGVLVAESYCIGPDFDRVQRSLKKYREKQPAACIVALTRHLASRNPTKRDIPERIFGVLEGDPVLLRSEYDTAYTHVKVATIGKGSEGHQTREKIRLISSARDTLSAMLDAHKASINEHRSTRGLCVMRYTRRGLAELEYDPKYR
jgi:hypothetical protein